MPAEDGIRRWSPKFKVAYDDHNFYVFVRRVRIRTPTAINTLLARPRRPHLL